MTDPLRIYVLWAPSPGQSKRIAQLIADHFDGLGMERDGVAIRVPVRFRSEAWACGNPAPARIDLGRADHNAVILLHDGFMQAQSAVWDSYVEELRERMDARGGRDLYLSFGSPDRDAALPSDARRHTQYTTRHRWQETLPRQEAQDARLLLHLAYALRRHLIGSAGGERLFVSHAKADGDSIARAIVDYVNDLGQDVPLSAFYDAKELSPGEDYERRFATEVSEATLLALVSDVYDSRPWCVFELTTAKRARRPIVLADIGQVRTARTFPYGANLPKVRLVPRLDDDLWIEQLLVATVSEGLRCDLFISQATARLAATGVTATVLPRPPELFDVVEQIGGPPSLLVYPDPPLGRVEVELLDKAIAEVSGGLTYKTLNEVA